MNFAPSKLFVISKFPCSLKLLEHFEQEDRQILLIYIETQPLPFASVKICNNFTQNTFPLILIFRLLLYILKSKNVFLFQK
jgi:hypothetical protein